MNIEQIDDKKVILSLTNEDMKKLNMDIDTISISKKHSRAVINKLLTYVSRDIGLSFKNKRIIIEALQYNGGCILLISTSEKNKRKTYRMTRYQGERIFVFDELQSLLTCIRELYRIVDTEMKSSIYYDENNYYLLLYGFSVFKIKYTKTIQEWCIRNCSGEYFSYTLGEHSSLLWKENALEHIGQYL